MNTAILPKSRKSESKVRIGGGLLLLSAAATVLMVFARVTADADQPTFAESLQAIADSRPIYIVNGVARLVAGFALTAGALYLLRTWIIRSLLATPVVPYLLAGSGAVTAFSGVCTIILAAYAPDLTGLSEGVESARWITGKVGFTLAGLALILAAKYQWQVGGALRKVAPASAIFGIAMQFIWLETATFMHPIIGAAFFLWLVAVGAMLASGRSVGLSKHPAKALL